MGVSKKWESYTPRSRASGRVVRVVSRAYEYSKSVESSRHFFLFVPVLAFMPAMPLPFLPCPFLSAPSAFAASFAFFASRLSASLARWILRAARAHRPACR